jgi:fructose-1,6-bisphosphatase I
MFDKLIAPVGTALDRFIAQNQKQFAYASGELSQLLRDISLASKIINREINRAGLGGLGGGWGTENVQGEAQQKLDVIANVRFTRALRRGGETCCVISEEEDEPIPVNDLAHYIVAIDPLDGSSNIDVNVPVGTVFSIYRRVSPIGSGMTDADLLQIGDRQVAAGYVLYGSSTMLVYTTGYGVNGFTYEPALGEYFLSHPTMKFPETGDTYSINDGLYFQMNDRQRAFIDHCRHQHYKGRYVGSMVADFHRNLLKGGIFLYPATDKNPKGKLRLLYECNPMAYIAEQAGGKAISDTGRIRAIQPASLHERSAMIVGSTHLVDEYLSFTQGKVDTQHGQAAQPNA